MLSVPKEELSEGVASVVSAILVVSAETVLSV